MNRIRISWFVSLLVLVAGSQLLAQAQSSSSGKKPNILVIMTDDVGIWNISAYHRGMMGGRTPNIESSTCEQLMQAKAQKKPPSPGEQKAMEMLRTDPEMRHEFVGIVADQVVDKLIQFGMIP